jgi:hypothetical protein
MSRYLNRYVLLMAGLALAIGGYIIFWSMASSRALAEAGRWIAAQRAEGVDIAHAPLRASGFPYRISVTARDLRVQDERGAQAWRLSGLLVATIQPWNPRHIIVQGEGLRAAVWPRGSAAPADAGAFAARLSAVLAGGAWQRLALDANAPFIALPGQVLHATRLAASLRRNRGEDKERPDGTFELAVQGEGLDLPPGLAPGFPPAVNRLNLTGQLSGALDGLAAWRESGGTLDFRLLDLLWGRIKVGGDGTLTVDRQMRPLGAMSATVQGYNDIVDALVAGRQIASGDGAMAKVALGALAERGEGGASTIKVAISAQDGRLFIGPVPVGRLRPLVP